MAHKRQKCKAKDALQAKDIKVQQNPASAGFVCHTCGTACKSGIDWPLTHPQQD